MHSAPAMNHSLVVGSLACLFVVVSTGCATSGAVEEAPLESSRQQKLRKSLTGTWRQTHVVDDGEQPPLGDAQKSWTFQQDGSGVYRIERPSAGVESEEEFQWRLEGRNLVIDRAESGETYYRAEAWSALQMKWYHYVDETYYILRPAGGSIDKAPGTRMGPGRRK